MKPETVSLCMIVKNEEANLADCLASLGDFADEIIIVDTGSTDRTVEIAESFGARVEHFTWIDDFAAARNESLKYAGGDWIFWLDADDRIPPESPAKLKQTVASGQADAYRCRMVSHIQGDPPSVSTADYTLLFRNGRGIRFEGAIHETVTPNLLRQGMTVGQTNIAIHHSGYATPARLRQKAARNLRILRRCVAQDPQNLHWQYHLGVALYQLDEFVEAIKPLERVVNGYQHTPGYDAHLYKSHLLLMSAYANTGNPLMAGNTLQRALSIFPDRRHLHITGAMMVLHLNQPAQAVDLLARAKTLSSQSDTEGDSWPPGVLEATLGRAQFQLARQRVKSGQLVDAVVAAQSALEGVPPGQHAEIYKLMAFCLNKLGHEEDALACWQLAEAS